MSKVHIQLILSKEYYPSAGEGGRFNLVKSLKSRSKTSLKKKFHLQTATSAREFQPALPKPALSILESLSQPSQSSKPIFHNKCLSTHQKKLLNPLNSEDKDKRGL